MFPDFTISQFLGQNTAVKDIKTLTPGVSPDALNWLTSKEKDSIELRRGYARLGTSEVMGNGKVTGIGVAIRYDGTEVPFYSHGRKVKYYDVDSDDTVEAGSSILPAAADGEDVWFEPYQGLAGSFMYFGSSNSGIYKTPTANPGSIVNQAVNNYRFGVFHIGQNRAFAGQRNGIVAGNNDETGLYLSYIDKDQLSDFTQVTGEAYGTGDGTTRTFAHTLSVISAPKTAMYPTVTDGVETFVDDRDGNMIGNMGGTGSVNYATGAVTVTFATAPLNAAAITCGYYHETSTSTGILDFTGSANGQGKSFRQDDGGGNLQAIFNINTVEYCLHQLKTWQFASSLDDTNSTNLPYRNVGIPYHRAADQGPDGIIFADLSRPTDPKFRKLEVLGGTNIETIEPKSISDSLDLSPYGFDYCVVHRWGDFEVFAVQEKIAGAANPFNSVFWVHNVVSDTWDRLNYFAACLAGYQGTLLAGDSISKNVYTLFSGFDEDGDIIENYWTSSRLNLGSPNLKNCRRMVIPGLIQPDQSVKVSLSYDGGPFSQVFVIDGRGAYVDTGTNTYIGGPTVGSKVIGGGGSTTAHPFEVDFPINSDRFVDVRIRIEALGIGFVSMHGFTFKDIRDKGRKNLPIRTT
jgi:hypothetical protein